MLLGISWHSFTNRTKFLECSYGCKLYKPVDEPPAGNSTRGTGT